MTYPKDKIVTWINLSDHLENPVKFPMGIRTNFLVVFLGSPDEVKYLYRWKTGESVVFLGEIPGMRGHGIFAGLDGLVRYGYHTDNFAVIPEEEL